MKIRKDFVTNSSSSSYIICFARIVNETEARPIIDKYGLEVFDREGVEGEKNWLGQLGADWAGAVIWNVDEILEKYPEDKFIIIQDYEEGFEDEYGDVIYSYDFEANESIECITVENGFSDINIAEGEGRNG